MPCRRFGGHCKNLLRPSRSWTWQMSSAAQAPHLIPDTADRLAYCERRITSPPPCLQLELEVTRQSARLRKSKQKARPKPTARVAQVTLRYRQVELPAPRHLSYRGPVPLWIVHAVEEEPRAGATRVEWFLLTTMAVTSPEHAERMPACCCLRWRIEDWHRVLKSGCGIEELRSETADRLERAIAIYLVIAWRILLMTLLGREVPDLPMGVLFIDVEIEVLTAFTRGRRDLKPPERLGDAVRLVARLGGYQDRKRDPPPGHQVLWLGATELRSMCKGVLLCRQWSGGDTVRSVTDSRSPAHRREGHRPAAAQSDRDVAAAPGRRAAPGRPARADASGAPEAGRCRWRASIRASMTASPKSRRARRSLWALQ